MTHAGGIVLCGGRSSRMGRPKAWLPFGDELMLQRVVRVLREVVEPVVVVAAPGQDVPPLPPEVEIVRDEVEGRGPLQGLATGLGALAGKADAAYLSSCDTPFLTAAFVRRMVSFLLPSPRCGRGVGGEGEASSSGKVTPLGGDAFPLTPAFGRPSPAEGEGEGTPAIAVPHVGGFFHPLAAVYRLSVTDIVLSLLAENRLRPVFLFDAVPTRIVEPQELADLDSLRNLNTPEDYESALCELRYNSSLTPGP